MPSTGSSSVSGGVRMRRPGTFAVIAAGAAVVVLLGAAVGTGRGSQPGASFRPAGRDVLVPANPLQGAASLGETIDRLQARLQAFPHDCLATASLGLAYVAQARLTADPGYYPKAQGVLNRTLALRCPDNAAGYTGLGALALARHDFGGALAWGERARAVDPFNAGVYGVIGDAEVELGRYPQAFATLQRMIDLRPDLASYARVSYARELQGDVSGAIAVMRRALGAAGDPSDQAFAAYQLGELFFNSGRPQRAGHWYGRATQLAPMYFPPRAGLAKVAWATGHPLVAISRYRVIVQRYPLPEYAIALGDLEAGGGDHESAGREYALVRAEERLFRAAGVNVDLELALFDADHGDPRRAVREARIEWSRRHGILVADAMAWALFKAGRPGRALVFARSALRLGSRNALIFFHAGMIELALQHTAVGLADLQRALRINPHFSIRYSSRAARTLARLEAAG
ncbi:MAG: tetratricopeptide repeat protein [Actinomycetota bacterium]